ncbi:MAG: hypothetical protein JKY52_06590 [Flavobacteriales bacterium]|nr:hypothetical protein [Flavobacteriales bacterium]
MRLILSALMLLGISFAAFAQDFIYTKDGKKVEVKVLEIRPNEILYKKKSNPDGPDYIVLKSEVLLITYENGTHESFVSKTPPPTPYEPTYPHGQATRSQYKPFDSLSVNFGKNYIAFNTMGLVSTNVSFSYERISKKGKLGVRIPLAIGFGSGTASYFINNSNVNQGSVFAYGLDLNFYPNGQGSVRYFIAPSFLITSFYYQFTDQFIDPVTGAWMIMDERLLGQQRVGLVKHGMLIQVSREFNLSFVVGLGLSMNDTKNEDFIQTKATFEFNVGYRF